MNKKQYISPDLKVFPIETEGVLAGSLQIGTASGSDPLTNEKEYSETDWNEPNYWEQYAQNIECKRKSPAHCSRRGFLFCRGVISLFPQHLAGGVAGLLDIHAGGQRTICRAVQPSA